MSVLKQKLQSLELERERQTNEVLHTYCGPSITYCMYITAVYVC